MVKKKSAPDRAVRQAEMDVKALRKRANKLLKSAQLDVKAYRHQLSVLKKQGIVAKRINVRSHLPTRYMMRKITKFKGVALGHDLAIPIRKLSPHRARQYTETGIAERIDKFLTVPKTAVRQRADIVKGHIRTVTELKRGQEEVIKFPSRMEDMHDILNWLDANEPMIRKLQGSHGQLGFQLSGYNSRTGLANVEALIKYLQQYDGSDPRYRGDIFSSENTKRIAREFVLIRFRPAKRTEVRPHSEPYYGVKRPSKGLKKDRKDQRRNQEYKRERARMRKASQRLAEDQETHDKRVAKQRERDRARANERREKRMFNKLMKPKKR